MEQVQPNDEVEIDLLDLLKQCLIQWRVIVVCAIICAFALSGVKYVKDVRAAKAATAEALEKAKEATDEIEQEESGLSKKDLKELQVKAKVARLRLTSEEANAVDVSLTSEKYMLQMNDYMEHSLLMQVDPYNERVLNLQYYIEGISPEKATILCESYTKQLTRGTYVANIGDALGCESGTDDRYIRELFSVSYSGSSQSDAQVAVVPILNMSLVIPDGVPGVRKTDPNDCVAAIDQSVAALQAELSESVGPHLIHRISAFNTEEVDFGLRSNITSNKSYVVDMQSSLKSTYSSFTDDQKAVFDAGLAELEKEYNYSHRTVKEDEEDTEDTVEEDDAAATIEQPSFSPKYFLLGLLVGIFLYICLYLIIIALRGRVLTSDELASYIRRPAFGESHAYEGRAGKGLRRFIWDRRVFERIYADSLASKPELAAGAAAKIATAVAMKEQPMKTITLLSLEEDTATVASFITAIQTDFHKNNADITMNTAVHSPSDIAMNAEVVASLGSVILVAQRSRTKRKDVGAFLALAREFDIDVLGSVVAE